MKQCDNGHFYDEARFESCPYCKENTGIGKTMAAVDIGKTVAAFPGILQLLLRQPSTAAKQSL